MGAADHEKRVISSLKTGARTIQGTEQQISSAKSEGGKGEDGVVDGAVIRLAEPAWCTNTLSVTINPLRPNPPF